ncbi:hypothetical protein [Streptomyces sp. H27-H5]|uniref:hypothetical protein n=1 Tax=Streptomyces sp. H27-H5 TaxID=2996460 RepID=UPI002271B04D|nr:hypothetical protein [Streptomyces sp. H27-H5]MCY0961867.1 hypothetical protein [Streptomyces sp. H27-H5]
MPAHGKAGACTAPAPWLVEGYSGTGEAMSLDRTVYACQAHLDTAETQWLRGLTSSTRTAVGLQWCGQWTDYAPPGEA